MDLVNHLDSFYTEEGYFQDSFNPLEIDDYIKAAEYLKKGYSLEDIKVNFQRRTPFETIQVRKITKVSTLPLTKSAEKRLQKLAAKRQEKIQQPFLRAA